MEIRNSISQAVKQLYNVNPFGEADKTKISAKGIGNKIAKIALAAISIPFFFIAVPVIAFKAKQISKLNNPMQKTSNAFTQVSKAESMSNFSDQVIEDAKLRLEKKSLSFSSRVGDCYLPTVYNYATHTKVRQKNMKTVTECLFVFTEGSQFALEQHGSVNKEVVKDNFNRSLETFSADELPAILEDIIIAYGELPLALGLDVKPLKDSLINLLSIELLNKLRESKNVSPFMKAFLKSHSTSPFLKEFFKSHIT